MSKTARWARGAAVAPMALLLLGLQSAGARATAQTASATSTPTAQTASQAPLTNPYSPAYGHAYRHGAVPTRAQQARMDAYAAGHSRPTSSSSETLSYGGGILNTDGSSVGVTSSTPKVYLVFWGSGWGQLTGGSNWGGITGSDTGTNLTFNNDPDGGASYIQNLFRGLGTAPSGGTEELWSATMTQYCDGPVPTGATSCPSGSSHVLYPTGGGVLAGVWYDGSTDTTTTTSATQIAQEAVAAAGHFGNSTPSSNRYVQYDILSPTGANPDNYLNSGFCAWHDYTGDGYSIQNPYGYVAFTNMPYVMDVGASCGMNFVNSGSAGTLDGYSIVNGHEYAETITDQFPAGGWTNRSSGSYSGEENGDECAWIGPGSGIGSAGDVAMSTGPTYGFAMQSTWSNYDQSCILDTDQPFASGGSGGGTITLTASGYKSHGSDIANLSWSGATGPVDVYRNGAVIQSSYSGTSYTDSTRGSTTNSYYVCPTGTTSGCSNTATVTF